MSHPNSGSVAATAADEFHSSGLLARSGAVCVSEAAVMSEAAAQVTAAVDQEAMKDMAQLAAKRKRVAELESAMRTFQAEQRRRQSGGQPSSLVAAVESPGGAIAMDQLTAEAIAFRYQQAQKQLGVEEGALHRLEKQVKVREEARVQAARRQHAEDLQRQQRQQREAQLNAAQRQQQRIAAAGGSGDRRPIRILPLSHATSPRGVHTPGAPPPHSAPLTFQEYQAGPLLHNMSKVEVKHQRQRRRYVDDTDASAFVERLNKRSRLEEAVRRGGAVPLSDVTVKKEEAEREQLHGRGVAEMEYVDVDALMEADETDELLSGLLKRENGEGSGEGLVAAPGAGTPLVLPSDRTVSLSSGFTIREDTYWRLLDYQQEGLEWLLELHARRQGGILGDEMGLGKTIQVAAMLSALSLSHQLQGPVLLVVPVTVIRQWVAELHRWTPYTRVAVLHSSSKSSSAGGGVEGIVNSMRGLGNAVLLTSYAGMRIHHHLLQTAGFQYVILDEGHKISNPTAGITLAAKAFPTPHRLLLTGTPIQNNLKELWSLFDFVRPGLLGNLNAFTEEFQDVIAKSRNPRATKETLVQAVEAANALRQRIAPFLLRRMKREVNARLPEKHEKVIYVPLGDEQLSEYMNLLASPTVQTFIAQASSYRLLSGGLNRDMRDSSGSLHVAGRSYQMASGGAGAARLRLQSFSILRQLRHICNHVDIYRVLKHEASRREHGSTTSSQGMMAEQDGAEGEGGGRSFRSNAPVNVSGGSKLETLKGMLAEWHQAGHRVLLFSQTRMMLDILENFVEMCQYRYLRMDGTTPTHQRQLLMDSFHDDESIFIALLTTRVGGVGLNLTAADRVVLFDPDWNPTTDAQARERAWRVGQRRDVWVYRLISVGTVEEFIFRRQLSKIYVADKVLIDPEYQRFDTHQDAFVEGLLLGSIYEPRVPDGMKHILAFKEQKAEKPAASPSSAAPALSPSSPSRGEMVVNYDTYSPSSPLTAGSSPPGSPNRAPGGGEDALSILQCMVDGADMYEPGHEVARRLAAYQAQEALQRVAASAVGDCDACLEQQREDFEKKQGE